jgi:hypothetical protein
MLTSLVSFLFALHAAALPVGRPARVPEVMSQQEMEVRVRIDVSRRLRVPLDKVRVLQVAERTWPDERLGCSARKPVADPAPTPGFRIVARARATRLTYHTDRAGHVLRCAVPAKKSKRSK